MAEPLLVIGLGNPGPQYAKTRHNVGFWFVDHLADKLKAALAPQAKFFGKAARAGDLWLLEPATFMNRSGQSVAALANFYKIPPDEILVIHDELDIPAGDVRLKVGGGEGGTVAGGRGDAGAGGAHQRRALVVPGVDHGAAGGHGGEHLTRWRWCSASPEARCWPGSSAVLPTR